MHTTMAHHHDVGSCISTSLVQSLQPRICMQAAPVVYVVPDILLLLLIYMTYHCVWVC
jgi:hypothetical protein